MRVLVDISGLVYRSAYKLHLTDRAGRNTGAAFGTMKSLGKLADIMRPEEMVICWDAGHVHQSELYPEYKADRKRDPEFQADLARQKDVLFAMLSRLPVINVREPGVEADDIIAVLARFLHCEQVGIVTGDSDLHCLASERCRIYSYDGKEVELELPPDQVIPCKVMVGGEDNIRGVTKIGPVTALKLLAAHKSLDGVLRYAEREGKLGAMPWAEVKRTVERNLRLMTPGDLLSNGERNSILDQYRYGRLNRVIDRGGFRDRLMESGFVSIVSRLNGYLMPFKRMERQSGQQAKAKAPTSRGASGSESRAASSSGDQGGRETRVIIRTEECSRIVCATEGASGSRGDGLAAKAASVLSHLRQASTVGVDAPGDGRGAQGALRGVHGEARAGRARARPADLLPDEKVLPKQHVVSRALSILQSLREGEGHAWLMSRPTKQLQRVLKLIDSVLGEGKQVPFDDEEFLYQLHEAFGSDLPTWMKTEQELKRDAKRLVRNRVQERSRGHSPSEEAGRSAPKPGRGRSS